MNYKKVWELLDGNKYVITQIAPAVRYALAEEFGMDSGKLSIGKIVAALKLLGFNLVFDTNFAADLTIMEEANEFVNKIEEKYEDLDVQCYRGAQPLYYFLMSVE